MKNLDSQMRRAAREAVRKLLQNRALHRNPVPGRVDDDIPIGGGGVAPFEPETWPLAVMYFDTMRSTVTAADVRSQNTGLSLSQSGTTTTIGGMTGAANNVGGGSVTLSGWTNPTNNGTFTLLPNGVSFTNAAGVTEATGVGKSISYPGSLSALEDLVTGLNYTAPAAGNRLGINLERGSDGKPVVGTNMTNNGRFVTYNDPSGNLYAPLGGNNDSSWFEYVYVVAAVSGGCWNMAVRSTAHGGGGPVDYLGYRASAAPMNSGASPKGGLTRKSSVGTTSYAVNASRPNGAWYAIGTDFDGATGVAEVFINGVSIGLSVAGTLRNVGPLYHGFLCCSNDVSSSTLQPNQSNALIAAAGAWGAKLGAGRQAALESYYRARYP
jgi:hypothetical protein